MRTWLCPFQGHSHDACLKLASCIGCDPLWCPWPGRCVLGPLLCRNHLGSLQSPPPTLSLTSCSVLVVAGGSFEEWLCETLGAWLPVHQAVRGWSQNVPEPDTAAQHTWTSQCTSRLALSSRTLAGVSHAHVREVRSWGRTLLSGTVA